MFLKHVDEQLADNLALGLGIANAFQIGQEQLALVSVDQRNIVVVPEHGHHFFRLVLTEQTVVDEHTGQLIADRLVDQNRGDRTVHAARQAANNPLAPDLLTDLADRLLAIRAHRPVAAEPCFADEVFVERFAVGSVVHFRMELDRIEAAIQICRDGEGRPGRRSVDLKARSDFTDVIAMAHPDLFAALKEPAVQQVDPVLASGDVGTSELRRVAFTGFDGSAQILHHDLLAITDAENRHTERIDSLRRPGRSFANNRIRPA